MKLFIGIATSGLLLFGGVYAMADEQAKLDAACELAREKELVPLRQQMTAQCIAEGKKDKQQCEAEYANYNGRTGNKQLPFYDLQECEQAFKKRQGSNRNRR